MLQPELGEIVRELRGERGYSSREDFANAAGVSPKTVERLETGHSVHTTSLAKILKELSIDNHTVNQRALERRNAKKTPASEIFSGQIIPRKYKDPILLVEAGEFSRFFRTIDELVSDEFGRVFAFTRNTDVEFSARRLFMSLCEIDIPVEIAISILEKVPVTLKHVVIDNVFDTSHIRMAVSQVIYGLPYDKTNNLNEDMLRDADPREPKTTFGRDEWELRKLDWARRYSRRYGDPNQAVNILEIDGSQTRLDYNFLRTELIPHMLNRLLGKEFNLGGDTLIKQNAISDMASCLLTEFKRTGLYTLKYKTALSLAEDFATQPPTPWFVTSETQAESIKYNLERATAHTASIQINSDVADENTWHRLLEVAQHSCAAILGAYGAYMGSKDRTSLHILRNWISISEKNLALWELCEMRYIDHDLRSLKINKGDFARFLKHLDMRLNSRKLETNEQAMEIASQMFDYASALVKQRQKMRNVRININETDQINVKDLLDIMAENISVIFELPKTRPLKK